MTTLLSIDTITNIIHSSSNTTYQFPVIGNIANCGRPFNIIRLGSGTYTFIMQPNEYFYCLTNDSLWSQTTSLSNSFVMKPNPGNNDFATTNVLYECSAINSFMSFYDSINKRFGWIQITKGSNLNPP